MHIALYALLAYGLTAIISLLVVAVIVWISRTMGGGRQDGSSDA